MVGAGDDSRALLALRSDAAVSQRRGQQWEVEFARYFTAPPRSPSTGPPPGVRYVFRSKHPHPGVWLPAAAPASVCVSRPSHASTATVLTVSIENVVFVRTASLPFPYLFVWLLVDVCLVDTISSLRALVCGGIWGFGRGYGFDDALVHVVSDSQISIHLLQELCEDICVVCQPGTIYVCVGI